MIPFFTELRVIRLTLLVLAAVCVVYARNSPVQTERHGMGTNCQRRGAGKGYGDAKNGEMEVATALHGRRRHVARIPNGRIGHAAYVGPKVPGPTACASINRKHIILGG